MLYYASMLVRFAMRSRTPLLWQGLSLGLVITFNLGSAYALACPILCSSQHCMEQSGASTMPGMPGSHPCCPARSSGKNGAPCGAPAKGCITHAQGGAVLIRSGTFIPHSHGAPVAAPGETAFLQNLADPLLRSSSLSPPGLLSGRAIWQKKTSLRI
jgi:hypothetical protein